jgi:cytochrome d ubiquinol oxidase subunit I
VNTLDIARWQFGVITVFHFLFVPITIGLSFLVAGLQTAWVRTGKEHYLRATRFWGKLFLINFAIGVVTGIVQEFQFGMNWSAYSRFVGDIFGAPLAIEGLLAFFMESTFLGLWIFGWGRLPKRIHLATIWIAATGTLLSAYFILAANAWMQHPVGYRIDQATNRAILTDFPKVLTQNTAVSAFAHTISACFLTAGMLMVAVCAWHLRRRTHLDVIRPSLRLALWVSLIAGLLTAGTGDIQARIMTQQQPMKMAAAEALYNTSSPASFSVFTIGSLNGSQEVWSLRVPHGLSLLAAATPDGTVEGINNIQTRYAAKYGPGDYKPNIPIAYWSFRLMIGFGALAILLALAGLWATRRGRLPSTRWWWRAVPAAFMLPLLANSFGWVFTEMGRQPWSVFGLIKTSKSVSPSVGPATAATSLVVLTLLYSALAVIEIGLMVRYAKHGPAEAPTELTEGRTDDNQPDDEPDRRPLAFAY